MQVGLGLIYRLYTLSNHKFIHLLLQVLCCILILVSTFAVASSKLYKMDDSTKLSNISFSYEERLYNNL